MYQIDKWFTYFTEGNLLKKYKSDIHTKFESVSVRIFESETKCWYLCHS